MQLFHAPVRLALIAVGLSLMPASLASAQNAPPKVASVASTTWAGSETLTQFGSLKFVFDGKGKVQMHDSATRAEDPSTIVRGSYVQNGADVEIRFGDCVYRGRINGQQMSGNAEFTTGQPRPWTFQVQLQPK